MKSKTKIEFQLKRKTNPVLVETIVLAKKNPKWMDVASILAGPKKKMKNLNVGELEKFSSEKIVVCGKILSEGEITKKVKVAALDFSEKAKEKLKKAGCETKTILEEINDNKEAKGVLILK